MEALRVIRVRLVVLPAWHDWHPLPRELVSDLYPQRCRWATRHLSYRLGFPMTTPPPASCDIMMSLSRFDSVVRDDPSALERDESRRSHHPDPAGHHHRRGGRALRGRDHLRRSPSLGKQLRSSGTAGTPQGGRFRQDCIFSGPGWPEKPMSPRSCYSDN